MRSRIVIVILAVVLGAVAAVMAAGYLRSARTDIAEQNQPVEVLVANQDLPRGLSGTELLKRKFVEIEKVPRQFVSADAVSSTRGLEEQVLVVPISAGEQLTKSRFQYPAQAGLAPSVPENYVAIACAVDDVSGVAGLIKPNDHVMVYATLASQPGAKADAKTVVLIPSARILAVGTSVGAETEEEAADEQKSGGALSGSSAKGEAPSTVTLALSPADAGKLVFSQENGTIRLALLPSAGQDVAAPAAISYNAVAR